MKVAGFFRAADTPFIASDARDDAARKLADAAGGWNAVAVGAARRPGVGVKQANEQAAVNEALSECAKRDSDCRVVAIGPFTVGPNYGKAQLSRLISRSKAGNPARSFNMKSASVASGQRTWLRPQGPRSSSAVFMPKLRAGMTSLSRRSPT